MNMTENTKSPVKQKIDKPEPPVSVVATHITPEFGGRKGPEATRYGDWEMNGKCVDF